MNSWKNALPGISAALIIVLGTLWGYLWSGGRLDFLIAWPSLLLIYLFGTFGATVLTFGWADGLRAIRSISVLFSDDSTHLDERDATILHRMIAYGYASGSLAVLSGILITLCHLVADLSMIRDHVASTLTIVLYPLFIGEFLLRPAATRIRYLLQLSKS